ncbi:hypothetical protein N7535_001034 [Penicillium sp. DV-2018c]|nr:hypothetical protein N7535_001034 [Penicillium sp. DV-2018c]
MLVTSICIPNTCSNEIVRQQGDAGRLFRAVPDRPRIGEVTVGDWKLLTTRIRARIQHEVREFDEALRIYPKKVAVQDYTHDRPCDLRIPILREKASHMGMGLVKRIQIRPATFPQSSMLLSVSVLCSWRTSGRLAV